MEEPTYKCHSQRSSRSRRAAVLQLAILEYQESGNCLWEARYAESLESLYVDMACLANSAGSVARRLSIHRATTVGPKSPLCQVILKNTTTVKETPNPTADVPNINRSQSLLTTTTRIPILAPPRGDRARIEALLSDVWSRKILPFPGITPRSRSEHLVRASASTMMRKLSVASITNSFAKRSGSSASMSTMKASEESAHHANESTESMAKRSCDSSSITLSADQDQVDVQRLPVIRDATERTSGCSARNSFDDGLVMSGMTRRHYSEKSQTSESKGSEDVIETAPSRDALSVPRPPAQHALQAVKYEARPAPMKKKENVSKANLAKRPVQETTSPVKPSKRSRATGSERSGVAGAIRSFFR